MKPKNKACLFLISAFCFLLSAFTQPQPQDLTPQTTIVILHTNDTHSNLESYNEPKEGDVGGIVRRNTFIRETRSQYPNTIVVDAGDFSQGTPYFNLFKGVPEIELMNKLGYDVAALGNHEFDNGSKALAKRLKKADFKIVCANYQFKNKSLAKLVKPFTIISAGDKKIGFFGLLRELKQVVLPSIYQEVTFIDPLHTAKKIVDILKNKEHCDLIVCISHLGIEPEYSGEITDREVAAAVSGIDFIIGGHNHKLFEVPEIIGDTKIVQVRKNGIYMGKILISE